MTRSQLVARTVTDNTGAYALHFLDTFDLKDTFFFYCLVESDTIFLRSIDRFESDSPTIDLAFPKNPIKRGNH